MSSSDDFRPELPFPPIPEGDGPEGDFWRAWAQHATHYLKWLVKSNSAAHKKLDQTNKQLEDFTDALRKYVKEDACVERHKIIDKALGSLDDDMGPILDHISSEDASESPTSTQEKKSWAKLAQEKISFIMAVIALVTAIGGGWWWSVKQAAAFKVMMDKQAEVMKELGRLRDKKAPPLPMLPPATNK